jgi:hypothetical protein
MEHKVLYVSEEGIRRHGLLRAVGDGRLTLREVTKALGASYRQAK